jgi:hypothetical protein
MQRKTKRQIAGVVIAAVAVGGGAVFGFAPEAAMEFAMKLLETVGMQ